jgi:hypothetical protein
LSGTGQLDGGEDPHVVCRPLSIRLSASFCAAVGLATVVFVASVALPSTLGILAAVVGIPPVVYVAIRGLRISLVADRSEIVVRNVLRTHRVRWEEVESIGIGLHHMGTVLLDAVSISRRGRRGVVTAQATASSSKERRRVIDGLRELRPELPIRYVSS